MKRISLVFVISSVLLLSLWNTALSKTPTLLSIGLISTIKSMKLPYEIETGLIEKVKVAHEKLSSSDAKLFKSATNQLRAFENQVRAQRGKHLSQIQADVLLKQSSNLIELIKRTTAKTVGISGGIVEVTDPSSPIYGAYVSIPPGALSSNTLITIVEETSPRPVSTNVASCGPVVRFGPEGLVFNKDVEIAVPVSNDCISNLGVYTSPLHGETFKKAGDVRLSNNLLITQVNHFSDFQAGSENGDPNAPYFDWTILLNVTLPTGKWAHMNAYVVHPDCSDPSDFFCIPDRIKSITVTASNGFEYKFIKGDYWFDVCNKIRNEVYGTDYQQHWYYAHKWIEQDMQSGEYTFKMIYEKDGVEKEVSIKRTFVVNPLPVVDRSTVQICRQMDEVGSCMEWGPADLFEGVPTDKPLKIRWEPIFYEGGAVYYQVRLHNWIGGQPIYRSALSTGTELTVPVEMVQRVLIDNATYIMRIWAFDNATIPNSHNRSQSMNIRFATGNISFSNSPIFDYARVVRSNFPFPLDNPYFEVNYAARVRLGLNGNILTGNDVRVFAYKPNNEYIELTNWTAAGDVWAIVAGEQPIGEYIFKAYLKNDPSKEVNLRDNYYRPRSLPIPQLSSPQHNATLNTLTPTFSWEPVEGAKVYELLLDKWTGSEWSRVFTSPWVEGTEYTLLFNLENNRTYQWRIRAYDSFSMDTIDNRSNSVWWRFLVQLPPP